MEEKYYTKPNVADSGKPILSHGTRITFTLTGQNGMIERHCMKLENAEGDSDCYYVRLDDGRLVIINETYLKLI